MFQNSAFLKKITKQMCVFGGNIVLSHSFQSVGGIVPLALSFYVPGPFVLNKETQLKYIRLFLWIK